MDCLKNKTENMAPDEKAKLFEVTAESILETITQYFFMCHICLNNFTSPTFLDCYHTFCLPCLDELRNSQGRSCNELACPDCRLTTSLMGRGTASLKPNFTMASLMDAVASQKKQLRVQQGAMVCNQCNNEAHAVVQCDDCDERLCQDCWLESESQHADHQTDIIDPSLSEKPPAAPKCKKHAEYPYCFYCATCEVLICAMCAAISHRSQEHKHQDIDEADNSTRQQICLLLSRSEKHLQDSISAKKSIEDQRESMLTQLLNRETQIQEEDVYYWDEDEDEDAPQEKQRILEDLRAFKTAREDDFSQALDCVQAKVDYAQNVTDRVSQQVADADKYQLLQHKEELLVRLEGVLDHGVPTPRLPMVFSIKVEPGQHAYRYLRGVHVTKSMRALNGKNGIYLAYYYRVRIRL